MDGKLNSVDGVLEGNLQTGSALIFTDRSSSGEDAVIDGISLEKLHNDILLRELAQPCGKRKYIST